MSPEKAVFAAPEHKKARRQAPAGSKGPDEPADQNLYWPLIYQRRPIGL